MAHEYFPPELDSDGFNCPSCGAFAHQKRQGVQYGNPRVGYRATDNVATTICSRCGAHAWWIDGRMVHPLGSIGPLAHPDMPKNVASDYDEARSIAAISPRGACALLRLGLQKLCAELGEPGKNINADIASLVKKGLLPQVQQALDALRVIGNNAVHPGAIDLNDDPATALALFSAMNLIVEQLISAPKHTAALYENLPAADREHIQQRDGVVTSS